jgi:class 3 adenylate cyclase
MWMKASPSDGPPQVLVVAAQPDRRARVQDDLRGAFLAWGAEQAEEAREWLEAQADDEIPPVVLVVAEDAAAGMAGILKIRQGEQARRSPVLLWLERAETVPPAQMGGPEDVHVGPWSPDLASRRVWGLARVVRAEFRANQHARTAMEQREQAQRWRRAYEKQNAALEQLRRFLPPVVVQAAQGGTVLKTARKNLTIMFSDIRGFTDASEFCDPADTVALLNDYLPECNRIVVENGGNLDKFMGDGILAWFGDPAENPDLPFLAVKTALKLHARLESLKLVWFERGVLPIGIGIGIATGPTTVGPIGGGERMDYTVIGSSVNLAARLQAFARGGDIVMADSTYQLVKDRVLVRDAREVSVRGFEKPVRIHTVTGLP